tara:strand:+ start:4414 stop:6762 length:2349 start_codon:yes stop_codon:yes gene_type:complete
MEKQKLTQSLEYASKLLIGNERKLLINSLLFNIAKVASFHRVKIDYDGAKDIPVCYNAILLGGSSMGKSSSLRAFGELLRDVEFLWKRDLEEKKAHLEESLKGLNVAKSVRMIPTLESQSGTHQGFLWNRFLLSIYGMGGSSLIQDEFLDHFVGGQNLSLDAYIKEAYDFGDNGEVLNKNFSSGSIKGVPSNVFLISTADKLSEDDRIMSSFRKLLIDGFARRFICGYSKKKTFRRITMGEKQKGLEESERLRPTIVQFFQDLDTGCRLNKENLTLTLEAEQYAFDKGEEFRLKSWNIERDRTQERFFSPMYNGRMWKLVRVAALIALFEDPSTNKIELIHLEVAIKIDDEMMESFIDLFSSVESFEESIPDKMLRTMKAQGKMTRTDLGKIIPRRHSGMARQGYFQQFEEMCMDNDIPLIITNEQTKGRPKISYEIEKPQHDFKKEDVTEYLTDDGSRFPGVYISICTPHKPVYQSVKAEKFIQPVEKICEYLTGPNKERPYMVGHCEKRSKKEHEKVITCVPFDIDNTPGIKFFQENLTPVEWEEIAAGVEKKSNGAKGVPTVQDVYDTLPQRFKEIDAKFPVMTKEMCHKILDGISYIFQPSKSDGLDKDLFVARDRYHGLLLLDAPLDVSVEGEPENGNGYKAFVQATYKLLGIDKYTDGALETLSQLLYRSKHDATLHKGKHLRGEKIKALSHTAKLFKAHGKITYVEGLEHTFRQYSHIPRGGEERIMCPLHTQTSGSPSFRLFRDDKGILNGYCHSQCTPGRLQVSPAIDNELRK